MTSAPDIGFDYRPSRRLPALLLAMAVLALAAIWWSGLPAALAVVASVMVVHYARISLRRLCDTRVCSVLWRSDGGWELSLEDDRRVQASLAGHRVLGGSVLLRLALAGSDDAVLLLAGDNLDADTRRRLRARLSAMPDSA